MITEYLTERDLYSLTNACDVYVSLHRAEGFGLGIAEAMSLGKAVIATDYSATTEFCRPGTALLVPFKMVSNDEQGFAGRIGDSWAEPDVDAAARALRCLYDNPQLRNDLGNRAKAFICDYFSIENVRRSVESFLGVSEP